jgi:hypothetical protein
MLRSIEFSIFVILNLVQNPRSLFIAVDPVSRHGMTNGVVRSYPQKKMVCLYFSLKGVFKMVLYLRKASLRGKGLPCVALAKQGVG